MKKLVQSLSSMEGIQILSREQLRKISGGTGNYSFNVSCECMQGGSVSIANCSQCETYCSSRGGQTTNSDCCTSTPKKPGE